MKKIAVISLGWLGSALAKRLTTSKKYEVIGAYHESPKGICEEFRFDINQSTKSTRLQDVDIIFFNLPPHAIHSLEVFKDFVKPLSQKRFIMIGSTSVYPGFGIFDETSELNPSTPNGHFIAGCEQIIASLCSDFLIIRAAGLYGLGRSPGYYLTGRDLYMNGLETVNLTGLEDLLDVIIRTLSSSSENHINAVNANHPTKQEYYTKFCLDRGLTPPNFLVCQAVEPRIITTQYEHYQFRTDLE